MPVSNSENDLLNCPFCGCKAVILKDSRNITFKIQCIKSAQHGNIQSRDKGKAVKLWNTRHKNDG
jgi:hypothetical protein